MPETRVKLTDQERLDAPDARALQELVYQYSREAFGDLVAGGAGALSAVVWAISDDGTTIMGSPGPFSLLTRERDLTRAQSSSPALNVAHAWKSMVFSFDPAASGHINFPVDLTAARADYIASGATLKTLIWARPVEVDADTDTRRVWDVSTQTEVPTPLQTRVNQRLEFTVSETEPAAGSGAAWAPIARASSWTFSGGLYTPNFDTVSAWDSEDLHAWTGEGGSVYDVDANLLSMAWLTDRIASDGASADSDAGLSSGYAPGEDRGGSLLTMLHFIRRGLQRVLAGGSGDVGVPSLPWTGIPHLSLGGARIRIEDLEAAHASTVSTLGDTTNLAKNNMRADRVLFSGVVEWVPAGLYSGVAEGWYLLNNVGIDRIQDNLQDFYLVFTNPGLVSGDNIGDYYISSVDITTLNAPESASYSSIKLKSRLLPFAFGNPNSWVASESKVSKLSNANNVLYGVLLSEHALGFYLSGVSKSTGLDVIIDPTTIPNNVYAFSVSLHCSKYAPGEVIA